TDRTAWWTGGPGGRVRDTCQPTDGNTPGGGSLHGAAALRIQFDQTHRGDCCWPAIRTRRLRGKRSVPRVLGGPGSRRRGTLPPRRISSRQEPAVRPAGPPACRITERDRRSIVAHRSQRRGSSRWGHRFMDANVLLVAVTLH